MSARHRAVGALVSVGIETEAVGMAVAKRPCRRGSGERRDRDSGWRDGCWQDATQYTYLPSSDERRSRDTGWRDGCRQDAAQYRNYLALMSTGVKTPAGGMAVSNTPRSRGSGERWDRDGGWWDGCQQEATY